jgi:hypothetical protein
MCHPLDLQDMVKPKK